MTKGAPKTIEFLPPPAEKLRRKLFTGNAEAPAVDVRAVARAEHALLEMGGTWRQSFDQAVLAMREALASTGVGEDNARIGRVLRAAMEVRGLSGPLGIQLVADISVSLVELLDRCRSLGPRERKGIMLHVDALDAAIRDTGGAADAAKSDAAELFERLNAKIKAGAKRR